MSYAAIFGRPHEVPMIMGFIGVSYSIGIITGPVIGGAFAENHNATWRWVSKGKTVILITRTNAEVHLGILHQCSICRRPFRVVYLRPTQLHSAKQCLCPHTARAYRLGRFYTSRQHCCSLPNGSNFWRCCVGMGFRFHDCDLGCLGCRPNLLHCATVFLSFHDC